MQVHREDRLQAMPPGHRGSRPAGFDKPAFLAGARRAVEVLQKGCSVGELSEIRGLTTDSMFADPQDRFREADA